MAIKAILDKLDDAPEALREHYTEKDGKFVLGVEPVGNYAIRIRFDDGHDTGIYAWDYLYWLGSNQEELWQTYLTRLQMAGFADESGRDVAMGEASGGGCGSH